MPTVETARAQTPRIDALPKVTGRGVYTEDLPLPPWTLYGAILRSPYATNQRRDVLYKVSHRLLTTYDRVAVEDLRIRNMVKNHHLSKSILDAGWSLFATHLTSKAANAGREVVFVNPAYTSRTCHACGQIALHLPLSMRVFRCTCGYVAGRDENAARNILRLGQSRWATSSTLVGLAQEAAPR
jgi:putative transposase